MRLGENDNGGTQPSSKIATFWSRGFFLGLGGAIVGLAFVSWSLWQLVGSLSALHALRQLNVQHVAVSRPNAAPLVGASPTVTMGSAAEASHGTSYAGGKTTTSTSLAAQTKPSTATVNLSQASPTLGPVSTASVDSTSNNGTSRPERLAFATFLAKNSKEKKFHGDMYFVTARILTYQLLYDPQTRSDIPFLVLVTPEFDPAKAAQLSRDGATVVPIQHIDSNGIAPKSGNWKYVFDKLQLFNMTEYDRILFMDADTVVRAPMAPIFDDQAAQVQKTLHRRSEIKKKEAKLPREYILAAKYEGSGHVARRRWWYPGETLLNRRTQQPKNVNYLNAGFFMLKPSREIYAYYLSLIANKCCFFPLYPEQNMLNYAHRRFGNMPWTELQYFWNVHGPIEKDFHTGIKSLHGHFWDPAFPSMMGGDRNKFWLRKRKEMEEYFDKHQN